jgi:hypothetical protein
MNIFLKKEQAQERYDICKTCNKFNAAIKQCAECRCFMPVKVKFINSSCPLKKWESQEQI